MKDTFGGRERGRKMKELIMYYIQLTLYYFSPCIYKSTILLSVLNYI